jgi:hypothetical protein
MAYIGFALTVTHFWKERNAAQPKVSKNSSLIHPALHFAAFRVPALRIAPWRTLATALHGLARSLGVLPRATTPALLQLAS